MLKITSVLLILPVLTGCAAAAGTFVYRPNTPPEVIQADADQCKIATFREIPQNIATQVNPGYSSPGTVQCYNTGYSTQCNTIGAIDIPATTTSYDVNAGLRQRQINACMASKGYSRTNFPFCKTDEEIADYNALKAKGAPASAFKCMVHHGEIQ